MRGRKPNPTPASNVVQGAFPGTETEPAIVDIEEPNWLLTVDIRQWGSRRAKIASERWKVLTQSLARKGLLDVDNDVLIEMAAGAYADWKLAEAHVARNGIMIKAPKTKVMMHNPYKAIADAAMKRVMAAERELGIPPTERGRAEKAPPRSGRKKRAADDYLGNK
ncbi:P27 family phage terminase small subunit [Rhizobium sp. YTUHZ045]|uniref:P27 family phage terminase small subunit n=1 Tax=Rhizobium TaxID=379 RepID=UPI001C82C85F|nr:P27 family phage terminase small subunit [Rhizobium bangladeshense]MBX4884029.1 P27 family phage terminase small subunit [Rhizobium bangladeshense]